MSVETGEANIAASEKPEPALIVIRPFDLHHCWNATSSYSSANTP